MALNKRIKVGGGYYKGHKCTVSSTPGDYTVAIFNTSGSVVNGISITPDAYGAGDTMALRHYNDSAGTGRVLAVIAESIHNVGAGATIMLDFPAGELLNPNECLLFTYTNTATQAMNVYLVTEFVGLKKTS